MTDDDIIDKILLDFETESNYFYMNDQSAIRKKYLKMAFAAGFDKKRKTSNRVVIKYSKYGEVLARYNSLTECAEKENLTKSNVCSYIKKRTGFKSHFGCTYEYEKIYDNM